MLRLGKMIKRKKTNKIAKKKQQRKRQEKYPENDKKTAGTSNIIINWYRGMYEEYQRYKIYSLIYYLKHFFFCTV